MADQPMDYQPQPSLLQVAQDVHEPAVAAPGGTTKGTNSRDLGYQTVPLYTCLAPYCESSFQRTKDLNLHYKLHRLPYEVLLANTIISTSGKPSQQLLCSSPDANLVQSGSNALLHGPTADSADYNVNEHTDGLLTHTSSLRDAYTIPPNSPSLSTAHNAFLVNEPQTPDVGEDQLTPLSLEAASTPIRPPRPQTPATGTPAPPGNVCATCGKTFKRAPDMQRHAKKHDPGAQRFDCLAAGCPYTGARGFLRPDKLADHRRNRH